MPLAPLSVGQHLHGDSASPGGGRFVIEKPLSAGGFAITYLARDQQLDDRCVIKELAIDQLMLRSGNEMVPLPGREADVAVWVQKVQKEAQTLHRLRSAGVVPIRATWRELGTAYFAMDFVDGIELPAEPTAGADWATWEPVARKFLAALGAIHAAGLVHGDIKPQNVLVNREGNPVIIDFGTARSTEEAKKTKLTTLAMTPGYCPPELAVRDRAKEMGPWSDLYSWALTVMGLVIRHGGIDGAPLDTSARMALAKHGHSDAGIGDESASALRAAGVPENWVRALMACVALEPSARPQSAEEVAARIDAPAVTGSQPAVTGSQPKVSSSVLPVTSLGNTGALPAVIGSNPRVTGSNPRVTGSNPAITGSLPAIPLDKKAAAARQKAIFGLIARLVVLLGVIGAGYYAYNAMYAEEVLEIPNTPAGDKLRWTMAVFNQKRGEVTEDEVLKNFSPEVTSKVTPKALVDNFLFLGRQNGVYELVSIEEGATDHNLIAVMRTTNLSLVELRISTENKPPFRFKSLAFEETKRRPKGSGFN